MSDTTGTRWFSLRRRLLGLLLAGVTACWLVATALIWNDSHAEIDALFDAQLAQTAQALLAQAEAELRSVRHHRPASELEEMAKVAHKYQRHVRCQIWRIDGTLLLRSQSAPETPMTLRDGFSEEDGSAGHWRYYAEWNAAHSLQVQVAEDHRIRDRMLGQIVQRLLWPAGFGLLLIALWVWVATRGGLAALNGIARQIGSRAAHQLHSVTPEQAPEEIRPMLDALNDLFRRVDATLEAERRFTADAAHELRTPLAALHAQAQVALRARDDAERERSLQQLREGLARASHLVEQLLALARLDPEVSPGEWSVVDLAAITADACAETGPLILERNIDFDLDAPQHAPVAGNAAWLRLLVRNLVDNAARYAPDGGRVEVRVERCDDVVRLCVHDNGPGIPEADRGRVFDRFHRIAGSGMPGSGLGLSIAARVAELHRAPLTLGGSPLGGLAACLHLPAPVATENTPGSGDADQATKDSGGIGRPVR